MKLTIAVAAVLQLAAAGHVSVRMPFLNPAGVTYLQGQHAYAVPSAYGAAPQFAPSAYDAHSQLAYAAQQQQLAYEGHNPYSGQVAYEQQQLAYAGAPVAVGYAQVPVKAAVAVPTVHHVPAVADVPVTKIEAEHGVIQKIVDVAKPAIKTQKYEIRRPAIQKQFYDIEERIIVRPVGSALVELDEPLSKSEKGPAVITSLEDHHHKQVSGHGVDIAAPVIPQVVAVTPASHTVSITPSTHNVGIASSHEYSHGSYPEQSVAQHYPEQVVVSSTPVPVHQEPIYVSSTPASYHETEDSIIVNSAAKHLANAEHAAEEAKHAHQEAVARAHYNAEANAHQEAVARENYNAQVHHEEAVARANYNAQAIAERDAIARANYAHAHHQEAVARADYNAQVNAHEDAIARANAEYNAQKEAIDRANYNAELQAHQHAVSTNAQANAHLAVEAHSNGAPQEAVIVKNAPVNVKNLNHLSHEEAQENQQKLLRLLTAKGGVAEIGFGRAGPAEHVGDAGISRARVLSATPSPLHEPIEEKTNTRRIVVSRPVHTLQEIDVIQPATKVERVAFNQPTIIKTAKLGYERIQTSVPVYGKALAPAIAHAQVPVGYYH